MDGFVVPHPSSTQPRNRKGQFMKRKRALATDGVEIDDAHPPSGRKGKKSVQSGSCSTRAPKRQTQRVAPRTFHQQPTELSGSARASKYENHVPAAEFRNDLRLAIEVYSAKFKDAQNKMFGEVDSMLGIPQQVVRKHMKDLLADIVCLNVCGLNPPCGVPFR